MRTDHWLRLAERRLAAVTDSPRLEAQVLAAHILREERTWLFAHPEHEFNELAGESLLQRRERHEPLAYILGWREFYGRRFRVTPAVLIPRQDTETLVEAAMALPWEPRDVLDIGTGSGAIAITLNWERPKWTITAVDISSEALEIAEENAETLGAEVRFVRSDIYSELGNDKFDLIVSNPPYIGTDESLPPDVRNHEPHAALFSGETGLEFYERLAKESGPHLIDGGRLMMEVGYQQAVKVRALFEEFGWRHVETIQDLSAVPRVVVVTRT